MNLEELFNDIKKLITPDTKDISIITDAIKKYRGIDWVGYINIQEEEYGRKLVAKNELFDMYVITWDAGQSSKVHDHAENGCVYKVLSNHLCEEVYNKDLSLKSVKCLHEKECGYINNNIGYHRIANETDKPAISLHIYSPPDYKANLFHVEEHDHH